MYSIRIDEKPRSHPKTMINRAELMHCRWDEAHALVFLCSSFHLCTCLSRYQKEKKMWIEVQIQSINNTQCTLQFRLSANLKVKYFATMWLEWAVIFGATNFWDLTCSFALDEQWTARRTICIERQVRFKSNFIDSLDGDFNVENKIIFHIFPRTKNIHEWN